MYSKQKEAERGKEVSPARPFVFLGPKCAVVPEWNGGKFWSVRPNLRSPPPTLSTVNDDEMEAESASRNASGEDVPGESTSEMSSASSRDSIRTTRSGASKRSKRSSTNSRNSKKSKPISKRRQRKTRQSSDNLIAATPDEEAHEDKVMTISSEEEDTARGPGRSITKSEGVRIRSKKKAKEELESINKKITAAKEIADGNYDSREYGGAKVERKILALEEDLRELSSRDIAAEMISKAQQVKMVAGKSGNLQGSMMRILNEATLYVRVGRDALANRVQATSSLEARANELEMARLREQTLA